MSSSAKEENSHSAMGNSHKKSLTPGFTYNIYVKTGDRPKSGTDANVYVVLHGNGSKSDETKLDALFRNDFERGQTDKFVLKHVNIADIECLELWRDTYGIGDSWNIDTITVENTNSGRKTVFPVFRWIKGNFRYKLIPLDTSLPQFDNRFEQRRQELEEKRKVYEFQVRSPGLPAQIKQIPADEQFSFDYLWDIKKMKFKLIATSALKIITTGHWDTIDDIKTMHTTKMFPPTSDYDRWQDDKKFGLQRIAGVNNIVIRLCKAIPDKLGVTPDMVAPFLEGMTLDQALDNNRIFIVDHDILDGCPTNPGVVVCAPVALFYQQNCGSLVPIAIQLNQQKGDDNPVFLPSDDKYTWILAKMWFNNADAQIHQSITHLGSTHFFMEGIPIATHRNLSQSHPLFKLLAPHFLYLIAINTHGLHKLLEPNGFFETTMSVGVTGGLELIKRNKPRWRMNIEGTLPNDLKEKGLDDLSRLPRYYFREDALAIYDAIKRYVTDYVNVYYTADSVLQQDNEVQSWREEIVKSCDEGGMGVLGVPGEEGRFTHTDQLIQTLTSVIYTCSVGHANANFAQYEEYSFAPNYPSILRGAPPKDKHPRTMKDLLDSIADKKTTYELLIITRILSERATKPLGDFEVNYIFDPKALEVLDKFKQDLRKISESIKKKNETRSPPYKYLDPDEVPNAISI